MKEAVMRELLQHATDELRHAGMIAGGLSSSAAHQ
jgi:hypothetical protein